MTRERATAAIYLVGLVGLVVAVRSVADDITYRQIADSRNTIAAAFVLTVTALVAASFGWCRLIGADGHRRVAAQRALFASQLAKYVPAGGVVQAASQIALTERLGFSLQRVLVGSVVWPLQIVAAGLIVGLPALISSSQQVRWFAVLLLPVVLVVSDPVVLARVLGRFKRFDTGRDLPERKELVRSFGWALANFAALALSFALLAASLSSDVALLPIAGAFSVAWVVGFLVVPLPGGVGVREAVLIALATGIDDGALLTAALLQRGLTLAAELTTLVAWSLWVRANSPSPGGVIDD